MSPIEPNDFSDEQIRKYIRTMILERQALVKQVEKLVEKKIESA